jgi:hypothetical protein
MNCIGKGGGGREIVSRPSGGRVGCGRGVNKRFLEVEVERLTGVGEAERCEGVRGSFIGV